MIHIDTWLVKWPCVTPKTGHGELFWPEPLFVPAGGAHTLCGLIIEDQTKGEQSNWSHPKEVVTCPTCRVLWDMVLELGLEQKA